MAQFLGILLLFWVVLLGAYFFFQRWFRSSDADKIKSRLMGTQKKAEKSDPSAKVALFDAEQAPKGTIIPNLLKNRRRVLD